MLSQETFLNELNIFRNDVEYVLRFLYTELAIHAIANKNKKILDTLSITPTFWNTVLNALQHSTFITLGRIFDIGSDHSIHKLRRIFEDNKDLFSKESFKERWLENDDRKKIEHWLPEYLNKLYVPSVKDFREFRLIISKNQRIYERIYRPVRNHFGHKKYSKNEEIQALFDMIKVRDIEKFCVQLGNIHESLWQLYENGRGPLIPFNKQRYSTKSILNKKYKPFCFKPINAMVIDETEIVLNLLKVGKFSKK